MKSWIVTIGGFPPAVRKAATRGQARYLAARRLCELGYFSSLRRAFMATTTCRLNREVGDAT